MASTSASLFLFQANQKAVKRKLLLLAAIWKPRPCNQKWHVNEINQKSSVFIRIYDSSVGKKVKQTRSPLSTVICGLKPAKERRRRVVKAFDLFVGWDHENEIVGRRWLHSPAAARKSQRPAEFSSLADLGGTNFIAAYEPTLTCGACFLPRGRFFFFFWLNHL